MMETAMAKKSVRKCDGCGKKLSARQKKIAKALDADKVLCAECTGRGKFPPSFYAIKERFAETLRKLRKE